ncbi:MAG: imidazole glycerol phosphate synthase subunit HisH [Acidimicrobiia bacterium]|nr:imidazole glycerol phosphate synthase subunit HisH [Acidimicrobiia bacterium]
MRPTIAVVDHGAGNLVSIGQGLARAGADIVMATAPSDLVGVDSVVLPGVGATRTVMDGIDAAGMRGPLTDLDVPLFGICVGMQVLFDSSDEDDAECLGLIPGVVRKLRNTPSLPHIGWNDLTIERPDPLFESVPDEPVYFVHSYAPEPTDPSTVVATSEHGERFVAAVRSGAVSGTQFHPERSGRVGLAIMANVVAAASRVNA